MVVVWTKDVTLEVVCELIGSGYASNVKTKGFVGEFSAQCNRKRKVKDDSKVLSLSNWTDGTSIHRDGEEHKKSRF